jgi:hypothetical protein
MVRFALYEAANALLYPWSALKAWAVRVAKRADGTLDIGL